MNGCTCPEPVENINPRHVGHCVKCSKILNSDWLSSDANLGTFFEALAEGMFPAYGRSLDRKQIPRWFYDLYRECSSREKAGRKKFGLAYLSHDGLRNAQEEAADFINYFYMRVLRCRRDGVDEKESVTLTGAKRAAQAWEVAQALKDEGPHPVSETAE